MDVQQEMQMVMELLVIQIANNAMSIQNATEKVQVTLSIEGTDDNPSVQPVFSDDWNFDIPPFHFQKIGENEVQVSFEYAATLTRKTKKGIIFTSHSEESRSYLKYERQLESILDLITISTNNALRIKPGTLKFKEIGTGYRSEQLSLSKRNVTFEAPELTGLQKRFSFLQRTKDQQVGNALRSYRKSLYDEDPNEKIPKLVSALEQLYSDRDQKLLTKIELADIRKAIRSCSNITADKKHILLQRIADTPLKGSKRWVVEKLNLMNEKGVISKKELENDVGYWFNMRNFSSHGEFLPRAGVNIDITLHQLSSTVETLLYGLVKPSVIKYIIVRDENVKKDFIESKGQLISKMENGYVAFAVRPDEVWIYEKNFPYDLVKEDSCFYLVDHNSIYQYTKTTKTQLDIKKVEPKARKNLIRIIKKLNTFLG